MADLSTMTLAQAKLRQKGIRTKLTTAVSRVANMVTKKLSLNDAQTQLQIAREVLGDLSEVHDRIIELLEEDTPDYEAQIDANLVYCNKIDVASAQVETYAEEKQAAGGAIGTNPPQPPETDQERAEREAREKAEEAVRAARLVLKEAEEAAQDLGLQVPPDDDDDDDIQSVSSVRTILPRSVKVPGGTMAPSTASVSSTTSQDFVAADKWIDDYVSGREKTVIPQRGDKSSIRVELHVYSGDPLDWFTWIGLWFALVHITAKTPVEKLAILRNHLRDGLRDLVYGLGGGEQAYMDALERLKETCGNRSAMRVAQIRALDQLDPPSDDQASFKRFAERVRTRLYDLTCIGEQGHADIIERLSVKLGLADRLAWNEGKGAGLETRTMRQFGAWLCSRATAYENAYAATSHFNRPNRVSSVSNNNNNNNTNRFQSSSNPAKFKKREGRTHHTAAAPSSKAEVKKVSAPRATGSSDTSVKEKQPVEPYCFKCDGDHWLPQCPFFKEMIVSERMRFCMRRGLCYACFGVRHGLERCSFKKECGRNGCKLFHHQLLHDDSKGTTNVSSCCAQVEVNRIAFGVICLDAVGADGRLVPVNVMLDSGSNSTLIREGLARKLRVKGQQQVLRISGVAGSSSTHESSEHLELSLQTAFGETVTVRGSTMKTITAPVQLVEWEKLRDRWAHLADLPPLRSAGGRVDVLVGLNHATLIAAVESRIGADDEPTATKTRLGWTVQGVVGEQTGTASVAALHATILRAFASTDVTPALLEQVRRFADTESFGTEYQDPAISIEDKKAVEMLEAKTKKLEVGYQAPVLWKDGTPPILPDNRIVAETRLRSLQNKFTRCGAAYETQYRKSMEKYFTEGYARRLTEEDLRLRPTRYWLPHFGVPKVPGQPELRLVFDAAAKHRGVCLNDYVVAGPPLLNSLPSVLIRFREGAIAWSADIGAMFSRIRIDEMDSRYHRFLWPELDGSLSPCEMISATFGVSSSPHVAIRTTWRAADDAGPDFAEAADAIRKNLYMDDYLDSARTIDEAIRRATAVNEALRRGDFHLGHWVANDPRILEAVKSPHLNQEKTVEDVTRETTQDAAVSLGGDDPEMLLGSTYRPATDMMGFRVKVTDVRYTRLGLLSKVAGLFDPQGAAAPMTVKAKIRLRELGVKGLKWDDAVTGEDRSWWEQYFAQLEQLREVQYPRCLFPDEDNIVRTELHIFTDASEEACSASAYLRHVYRDERVLVRHVKSVTKLAPLKTVSVCKLELNAALMGARLAKFVQSSLRRKIECRFFWTDSSTVRNWVRSVSSHYMVYVSNRVGEIQTLTEPTEWRFVPGVLNPSDAATRSQLEEKAVPSFWLEGPAFLYEPEANWPVDLPWMQERTELRSAHTNLSTAASTDADEWKKLRIPAADVPKLTRLEGEYKEWVKRAQQESYPDELNRLKRKKLLRPTSKLQALTPFLDDEGVMRLGGRLSRAKLPYDVMHPPILPGRHPLSRSIIRAFHENQHHSGTDFVMAQVRQHFWITSAREAVKKVRNECIPCRRFRPKAALQMMADIHKARLGAHQPPFTYTSVDYFGPFDVSHGRGTAKRWGALFTCLVTRAVYVDVAVSLSSVDFMNVLRRFFSIYRKPAEMFSDNGTNLTGAERLLREEIEKMKGDGVLVTELKSLGIRWHFQPAQTPHFGGAHESLVRSVKNALYPVLEEELKGLRYPSDDMLRTLFFEVAGLLNTRPLTYVSCDPDDFRPITPNDFLNRAPMADLPAGDFTRSLPRDHYRYVQRMVNLFWDLWHGAFLQSMVGRNKWTTPARNLAVGDVVLDDWKDAPRARWRMGRVTRVYPGADGLVRAVDVEFSTGVLRRGSNQLALLEASSTVPASGEDGAAISTRTEK